MASLLQCTPQTGVSQKLASFAAAVGCRDAAGESHQQSLQASSLCPQSSLQRLPVQKLCKPSSERTRKIEREDLGFVNGGIVNLKLDSGILRGHSR